MVTTTMPGDDIIFVRPNQAAEMLGLLRRDITKLCDSQHLDARVQGRKILITVESIKRYAASLPVRD
jgi:hypothetical protein